MSGSARESRKFRILLATPRYHELEEFVFALAREEHDPVTVGSGNDALDLVASLSPDLVIVDEGLPDREPLDLVREIAGLNARVNTAVITDLNKEEFHAGSEGLGVLCSLPGKPGAEEASRLVRKMACLLPQSESVITG